MNEKYFSKELMKKYEDFRELESKLKSKEYYLLESIRREFNDKKIKISKLIEKLEKRKSELNSKIKKKQKELPILTCGYLEGDTDWREPSKLENDIRKLKREKYKIEKFIEILKETKKKIGYPYSFYGEVPLKKFVSDNWNRHEVSWLK